MTHRLFRPCALGSIILVCVFLPRTTHAQLPPPPDASVAGPLPVPIPMANPPFAGQPVRRPDWEAAAAVGNSWGGSTVLGTKGDWVFGAAAGPGVGPYFGPGYWWCSGW